MPPRVLVGAALLLGLVCVAPELARAERTYAVRIVSTPPGATLFVDDKSKGSVGKTPWAGKLTAGPHVLVIELDGYESQVKDFRVRKRRKRQTVKVTLEEIESGTISVTVGDDDSALGAKILIDGEAKGELPNDADVDAGAHQVELIKKGYERFEEWVEVVKGKTVTVKATMVLVKKKVVKKPSTSKPVAPGTGPRVIVGAGIEAGWRRYTYDNARTAPLLPLRTSSVALFHLWAEAMPFARSANPRLRPLGATVDVALAAPIESSTMGSVDTVDTTWRELDVGLRYALSVGGAGTISPRLGYGQTLFSFDDSGVLAGQLPDVDYRFVRVGLDASYRFPVGKARLELFGGADYLAVLSPGPLADRFRDASVSGVDVRGGLAVRPRAQIEARVTGTLTQYNYVFTSMSGDMYDADGGRDRYYGLMFTAAYVY